MTAKKNQIFLNRSFSLFARFRQKESYGDLHHNGVASALLHDGSRRGEG